MWAGKIAVVMAEGPAEERRQARWHRPLAGTDGRRPYGPVDETVNEWLRAQAAPGCNRAILSRLEASAAREARRRRPAPAT